LLSILSLQSLVLSAETIIPLYVVKRHGTLGTEKVALIMIFTEVAGLIFSPIIGNVLERWGRKNIIVAGFITITIGTVMMGLTDFIENDITYLVLAIVCRFIQGAGDQ
jgi:MFS family permease